MKSKILLFSSAVALFLALPGANAWCRTESCFQSCLSFGNSHKTCLSTCCDMNSDNYLSIAECHNGCNQECSSQNQTDTNYKCYSSCMIGCSTQDKQLSNNTQQNEAIQEQPVPVVPETKADQEFITINDHNEYVSYLQCEESCMQQTSVFKIETCQKSCAISYIKNVTSAYQFQWYALHQSVFNSESTCDNNCLAYHGSQICCQPFNKKLVNLVRNSTNACPTGSDNPHYCLNQYYKGFNLTQGTHVNDEYVAECQSHSEREVRIRCYLKAQSLEEPAPFISGDVEELYEEYKKAIKLAEIDENFKDYLQCAIICPNQECEEECFNNLRNEFVYEVVIESNIKALTCEANCWSRKCSDQCWINHKKDLANLMTINKLEVYSRVSLDPLYETNKTVYEEYQKCSLECYINDNYTDCYDECERSLVENMYNEAEQSLYPQDAFSFFKSNQNLAAYTRCIMQSRGNAQYKVCNDDFYKGQVSMFASLYWHQSLYTANSPYSYTFALHDEFAVQIEESNNTIQENMTQMENQTLLIQQVMTTKALMSIDKFTAKVDQLIEDEIARREQLEREKVNKRVYILKNEARNRYYRQLKHEWLTSLDLSTFNRPQCNTTCAAQCFTGGSLQDPNFAQTAYYCAAYTCECQIINEMAYMQIEQLVPPINSYPEYQMHQINERTIMESERNVNNYHCDINCGTNCLKYPLQYDAVEVCLSQTCRCTFNYFYQDPSECSLSCANNCQYLSNPQESTQCMAFCGCDEFYTNKQSFVARQQVLFTQPQEQPTVKPRMANLKKYLFVGMFIIMMYATVYTVIKVKSQSSDKGFIERPMQQDKKKKRVIKDQVYQKMSNKDNKAEEEVFEFEGTYEKVF